MHTLLHLHGIMDLYKSFGHPSSPHFIQNLDSKSQTRRLYMEFLLEQFLDRIKIGNALVGLAEKPKNGPQTVVRKDDLDDGPALSGLLKSYSTFKTEKRPGEMKAFVDVMSYIIQLSRAIGSIYGLQIIITSKNSYSPCVFEALKNLIPTVCNFSEDFFADSGITKLVIGETNIEAVSDPKHSLFIPRDFGKSAKDGIEELHDAIFYHLLTRKPDMLIQLGSFLDPYEVESSKDLSSVSSGSIN